MTDDTPPPAPPAEPAPRPQTAGDFVDKIKLPEAQRPGTFRDWLIGFPTSGLFFMIVGGVILWKAYETMGTAYASMSFVLVVVGVAILLYGTGTQGIGQLESDHSTGELASYKVALAGGAGVIAFCVAGGIIAFRSQIKEAFRIEQGYIRFQIRGDGLSTEDIGLYVPDIRINGERVPAVRRSDRIEVYAPYLKKGTDTDFDIHVKLLLPEAAGGLLARTENTYKITLTKDGKIVDGSSSREFDTDAGYDFPKYQIVSPIKIQKAAEVSGVAVQ